MTTSEMPTTPSPPQGGVVGMCTKCGDRSRRGKNAPWCRECYRLHAVEYYAKRREPTVTEERECAYERCDEVFTWTSRFPNKQCCGQTCTKKKRYWDAKPPETKHPEGMQNCSGCSTAKIEADFSPSQYKRRGRCRECMAVYERVWAKNNVSKRSAASRRTKARRLLQKYGAYTDDIDQIVADQGGMCASCKRLPGAKGFQIDHDHETNRFRGLLCASCNLAAGCVGDDEEVLRRLIAYLQVHHAHRYEVASH